MARRIDREPDLANAIRTAGLTTREYSLLTLSFFNAMFAHGMKKAGTIKELPADILPENIAFIQSNEAELNQIFAQLQAYDVFADMRPRSGASRSVSSRDRAGAS